MIEAMRAYYPINVLKPAATNVWIVDGPIIRVPLCGFGMPFPTRMTIVRLADGDLFVHSPTVLTAELKAAIKALGTPRFLIAPSWLHYWWLPDWKRAFPKARVFVAGGVRKRARKHINFDTESLEADQGYPWDDGIYTLPASGRFRTEVIFFHSESRTLILTDFIENFEPRMIDSLFVRLLVRLGGVQHPHAGMPRDMRLTYSRKKLRSIVATMLSWNPERIIIAHGRWYDKDGAGELRRAFRGLIRRKWRG
jgi:Domain of unknown function (DUF4336)